MHASANRSSEPCGIHLAGCTAASIRPNSGVEKSVDRGNHRPLIDVAQRTAELCHDPGKRVTPLRCQPSVERVYLTQSKNRGRITINERTVELFANVEAYYAAKSDAASAMRYHALKAEGVAIGSGVVEAANKTLVTQRMKRSGMRWRIAGGQAVLTFRALIKSARFDRAWKAIIGATDTPANDNINPCAVIAIAA